MSLKRSFQALCLTAISALLLAACGGGGGDSTTDTSWSGKTIELGSIYSETGAGVAFGPQQLKAAQLAVEEINADGGVNGATLKLNQIDDHSEPAQSAKAAQKLIDGKALAILGPTFSNSAAEAHPLADKNGIAMLATSNTGPGIVGDCPYSCENVFRDSLGEEQAIPANVDTLAADSKAGSAIVVHPADDPFGDSTAQIAGQALADDSIDVLDDVTLPADSKQAAATLKGALAKKPDVLFITASSGEAAAGLIDAARSDDFKGDILGGNAFNSQLASKGAGSQGKGAQSAAAWYLGNDDEANVSFVQAYKSRYGENPDQFAAQAYTGVQLLAEAARESDLSFDDVDADRKALATSLAGVHMATPLGEFAFTADHDVSQPIWVVGMDGKGGYTLVEKIDPADA